MKNLLAIAVLFLLAGLSAFAQDIPGNNSSTVTVTAEVVHYDLSIVNDGDVTLTGTYYPGNTYTLTEDTRFTIQGTKGAQVTVTTTDPNPLTHASGATLAWSTALASPVTLTPVAGQPYGDSFFDVMWTTLDVSTLIAPASLSFTLTYSVVYL